MPGKQRIRELLTTPLTQDHLARKQAEGWRPVAIEWEREPPGQGPHGPVLEAVPYGLRVASDHVHLEEDPAEVEVMLTILEGIVEDWPMSRVAAGLNRLGYTMRTGEPWTQSAVFELLPRLIEFGPRLFHRDDWIARRRALRHRAATGT